MDSDSWLPIFAIAALILAACYFAMAETALASANRIRIKSLAEDGDRRAVKVSALIDNFDKTLTTLLVGTNIVHIACASLTTLFVTRLWGSGAVVVSTVVLAIVVFFVAEMLPKSFARSYPEQTALALAPSLRLILTLLTPLSFLFSGISKLLTRLFGEKETPTVTEDELYDIIESIGEEGGIEEEASRLIHSALEFDDITVQQVLTPRNRMIALSIDDSPEEILSVIRECRHSRLPVYRKTPDNIVGVLNIRRYLKAYLAQPAGLSLTELLDPPYFLPRKRRIDDALSDMSAHKQHLSVVRDDFGGVLGIVTVEDILEELVGEIWDEDDDPVQELKERAVRNPALKAFEREKTGETEDASSLQEERSQP
ncbi:MAG: HlyC/CorC family transporter [Clostridia bacterium]|nr:HlyC/CorC family transporter [Clostridia bacterium]